ncbi:MarR family transcriptional regulator [Dactylosporangium sp. NPDC000244]|uniref:MarR family winged helix-turn-helix transcriptional regulator n=1 Tax=Dactylosporangium sp. NPDC000244 TaxID=3154365 RepID=UPI003321599A
MLGLLLELVVFVGDDMQRRLARDDLTAARAGVLWALRARGPVTQRELATALAVTPRNVTGLVDGLAAAGHVTREPHPTDRRATLVTLTPAGTRLVERLEDEQREFAGLLFDDMPAERLDALGGGLAEILERMRG